MHCAARSQQGLQCCVSVCFSAPVMELSRSRAKLMRRGAGVGQVVDLVQQCWAQEPSQRPKMADVCRRLESILGEVKARVRTERTRQ
jgi:hypothetical protein